MSEYLSKKCIALCRPLPLKIADKCTLTEHLRCLNMKAIHTIVKKWSSHLFDRFSILTWLHVLGPSKMSIKCSSNMHFYY